MPTSKKRVKKVSREAPVETNDSGVAEVEKPAPKEAGFGFAAARRQGGKPPAAPPPKMMRGRGANRGR